MAQNTRPTDLSKYIKAPTANEIVNIGSYTNEQGVTQDYNSIYTNLVTSGEAKSLHKSLDFSNVGMPTDNTLNNTARLRQFHQTRLYINGFDGMFGHTKRQTNNREKTYLISANLPESFQYSIGSSWSTPIKGSDRADLGNVFMQMGGSEIIGGIAEKIFGGAVTADDLPSLNNRISTLLVWNGSKPLSLSLTIPVIDDGHPQSDTASSTGVNTNFVEALEFLGSLCLPKISGNLGFYEPPPSPFKANFNIGNLSLNLKGKYAHILLQLGGILLVDNVIIQDVAVNYPNTKTLIRHWYSGSTNPGVNSGDSTYLTPLLATVTIKLTTAEAITANTFSNMLWLKQQADSTTYGNAVSSQAQNGLSNTNVKSFTSTAISKMRNALGEYLPFLSESSESKQQQA